jgi:hypothetical protein
MIETAAMFIGGSVASRCQQACSALRKAKCCTRCKTPKTVRKLTARQHRGNWLTLCRQCSSYLDCDDLVEAAQREERMTRFRSATPEQKREMVRELRDPELARKLRELRQSELRRVEQRSDSREAAQVGLGEVIPARELKRRRRRVGAI